MMWRQRSRGVDARLAQMARAVGINLILRRRTVGRGHHRWIKANFRPHLVQACRRRADRAPWMQRREQLLAWRLLFLRGILAVVRLHGRTFGTGRERRQLMRRRAATYDRRSPPTEAGGAIWNSRRTTSTTKPPIVSRAVSVHSYLQRGCESGSPDAAPRRMRSRGLVSGAAGGKAREVLVKRTTSKRSTRSCAEETMSISRRSAGDAVAVTLTASWPIRLAAVPDRPSPATRPARPRAGASRESRATVGTARAAVHIYESVVRAIPRRLPERLWQRQGSPNCVERFKQPVDRRTHQRWSTCTDQYRQCARARADDSSRRRAAVDDAGRRAPAPRFATAPRLRGASPPSRRGAGRALRGAVALHNQEIKRTPLRMVSA